MSTELNRRSFFQLLGAAAVAAASIPVAAQAIIPAAPMSPSLGDIEVMIDGAWRLVGRAASVEFQSNIEYLELKSSFSDGVIRAKGARDERGKIVFEADQFSNFNPSVVMDAFCADGLTRLRAHVGAEAPMEVSVVLMALMYAYKLYGVSTAELDLVVLKGA